MAGGIATPTAAQGRVPAALHDPLRLRKGLGHVRDDHFVLHATGVAHGHVLEHLGRGAARVEADDGDGEHHRKAHRIPLASAPWTGVPGSYSEKSITGRRLVSRGVLRRWARLVESMGYVRLR